MLKLGIAAAVVLLVSTACGAGSPGPPAAPIANVTQPPQSTAQPTPQPTVGPTDAVPTPGRPPTPGAPWYLAVGDSISAGYTLDATRTINEGWPVQLQGLLAGRGAEWGLVDTACPGETTVSYRTGCGQRSLVPGLVGTQHDAVMTAIRLQPASLRLIIVQLGSNDLLRASFDGDDPAQAVSALAQRLDGIIAELQAAAPGVPLIVANYYDPFENSLPATLGPLVNANNHVASVATAHHARVADFFAAVNTAVPPDQALCQWVDCAHNDVHPTVAGHGRLAQAVLAALPTTVP